MLERKTVMNPRITVVTIALAALFAADSAVAQDPPISRRPADGMVVDGNTWRNPTVGEVLRLLGMDKDEAYPLLYGQNVERPAIAILRQELEPRGEAELDALANTVADMILADQTPEGRIRSNASWVLQAAARDDVSYGGTPHAGSFDALVRIYETRAAEVLADTGGNDPFLAAERSGTTYYGLSLYHIFRTDTVGRGRDYVLAVHRSSDPPPDNCQRGGGPRSEQDVLERPWCQYDPRSTTWCVAGRLLYGAIVDAAIERKYGSVWNDPGASGPLPVDGLPEMAAAWWRVCWTGLTPR